MERTHPLGSSHVNSERQRGSHVQFSDAEFPGVNTTSLIKPA